MSVPVLTAVTDGQWEADLVAALDRTDLGVAVVRRCVDLADLLATAATGSARAALLSADLRRLDRDALARLALADVAVIGLVQPGNADAERRLRQLGVPSVLPADAAPAVIAAAVVEVVGGGTRPPTGYGDPRRALPDEPPPTGEVAEGPVRGQVVAVWGPTGAPGRTTVAVGLAGELARLGTRTLLADADAYGGAVAPVLGLLDESPGLAAAARLANAGTLDVAALARLARTVAPRLRVLTGISRPDRWPELRPSALESVWALCRGLATVTVVDCGFGLEQDEELSYDTAAPRRNGATLVTLEAADVVIAVGGADPVSLQRLIRGLADLREVRPEPPLVVVNRLRKGVAGGNPAAEVTAALHRYAGVAAPVLVPYDRAGLDAALAGGRELAEAAPSSATRAALVSLAVRISGTSPTARRGWSRLRRSS